MLCTSESIRPLTSIVSYPERGEGGNNKYRGNCSPKLIEDLIGFFKPSEICDYMCGSGTTGAAAAKCGISSKLYDLHSGFDLMNSEIPDRPEFIFWHPPYWDIIKYSDVMYRASDVQNRYGYNPCQFDLSRIAEWDEFVKAMNYAMMKQFSALEKGGRMTKNIWLCRSFGKVWEVKQMTKSEFAEILTRATEGDHTALGRIFELYMPLIDKHSVVGGRFDEDCKQYIMFQIVLQITRFKI